MTMCLATPGKIVRIINDDAAFRTGQVSFDGALREVNLTFVPDAAPGDYVLVHAGLAIETIDEDAAREVFEALGELGGADDEGIP